MPQASAVRHTVVVVDDDPLVREAFHAFFLHQPSFRQLGEASDGRAAVTAYARWTPDVMLMDLQMPVMSGIEATQEITRRWPGACVVALTTFGGADHVVRALRAGAAGYLVKDAGAQALTTAMVAAINGEMPLSPSVRRELVTALVNEPQRHRRPVNDLVTPREREVLVWLAHGLSNSEIAARLFVSEGSIKQYLAHIGEKLGVKSRTQILVRAMQLDLIDPHELPDLSSPI